MAIYRIYPEKDTFIWSLPNDAGKYGNAGKDEILEIGGYPDSGSTGRTNRSLIQFRTKDITKAFSDKVTGLFSASLHLSLAEAGNLPTDFKVETFPVSQSWTVGIGKRDNNPTDYSGTTWKYRNAERTDTWASLGGDTLAISGLSLIHI